MGQKRKPTAKERIINALSKGEMNWSGLWTETDLGSGTLNQAIKELLDEKKIETVPKDFEAWLKLTNLPE